MKRIVVKEFDTIICNPDYKDNKSFIYLDKKLFSELEHFIKDYQSKESETDILEFMRMGYRRGVGDTISFNSFVGMIELPSGFQMEILPKVPLDHDEDNKKTKRLFLDMLRCLKDFEGKSFGKASIDTDKMNLYEIFIRMYLQETRALVKRGLKSSYISQEENLNYFKGKLQMGRHIRMNSSHKERFFMQYDEYQMNRPENRLIKATLQKLQRISTSAENQKEIRQLLYSFEMVEPSMNYEKDFAGIVIARDNREYELLIAWAKAFLLNKSFTTFSGETTGRAILFPMEQVFEAFVAKWIKHYFAEWSSKQLQVTAQDRGFYLFDEPKRFRLRPDIVIRDRENNNQPVILDTKWKRLNADPRGNYGISQADMYQMYAYAKKYDSSDIWLIYPYHDEVSRVGNISYNAHEADKSINVHVFMIDLENWKNSLRMLYDSMVSIEMIHKVNRECFERNQV